MTIPKSWLDEFGIVSQVELVRTPGGILVAPPREAMPSIEDEPAFATFLRFVLDDALAHPQKLGDPSDFLADDEGLFVGVDPD